jgi:hypothetical protein
MSFGFAGAHRTGKTTLAKRVAEELRFCYHDASVSKIMKEAGINAVGDVPIEQRMEAQEFLLTRYLKDLSLAPRPLVTDRTPLDMIGYMLGEVTMHNTTAEVGERVHAYWERCIEATVQHFDTIILVRPLDAYMADPKSPPLNLGYQTTVQMIIEGAAWAVTGAVYVETLFTTDLGARVDISKQFILDRMDEISRQSAAVRKH